jgi:hypothetical protein
VHARPRYSSHGSDPFRQRAAPRTRRGTERCFALALDDAGIPDDTRLRSTLVDWFAWSNRVVNHRYDGPELVPDELTLPHWSWDGPVE